MKLAQVRPNKFSGVLVVQSLTYLSLLIMSAIKLQETMCMYCVFNTLIII